MEVRNPVGIPAFSSGRRPTGRALPTSRVRAALPRAASRPGEKCRSAAPPPRPGATAPSSSSALPIQLPGAKPPPAAPRPYPISSPRTLPHIGGAPEPPHLAGSVPTRTRQAGDPPPPLRRRPHRATRTSPELTHLVRDEPAAPPLRRRTSPSPEIHTPRTVTVWFVWYAFSLPQFLTIHYV